MKFKTVAFWIILLLYFLLYIIFFLSIEVEAIFIDFLSIYLNINRTITQVWIDENIRVPLALITIGFSLYRFFKFYEKRWILIIFMYGFYLVLYYMAKGIASGGLT